MQPGRPMTVAETMEHRKPPASGGVETWICPDCGHRENAIDSSEPDPTGQSRSDLERWEGEGGAAPSQE
jgi:hypothetical protein